MKAWNLSTWLANFISELLRALSDWNISVLLEVCVWKTISPKKLSKNPPIRWTLDRNWIPWPLAAAQSAAVSDEYMLRNHRKILSPIPEHKQMVGSYTSRGFLESKSYNFMGLLTVMMLPKGRGENIWALPYSCGDK